MTQRAFRLPAIARPIRYTVELTTHPDRSDFVGTVEVDLTLSQPSAQIVLHARELTIQRASVEQAGQQQPCSVSLSATEESATFSCATPLLPGPARLHIAFAGPLAPTMHGMYLSTDGVHRAICTQCEATDARAIFPCFDEPEFKAELKWTLRTKPGLVALTNGPVSERHEHTDSAGNPEQVVAFQPTKPVSSYLAAVAIGDFESSPEVFVRDIPLRVYAPRGKGAQTAYAQALSARLLPWYEEYFAFPYPFAKYDQVAVPSFDAGAMENIGLVLFRQNLLLMDPKTVSWRQEKTIARVIAHEMAHQWFGNVVTMRWWDDLWLNEAFAEWMAHKIVHALEPSYRIWDDFAEDKMRALFDDALQSTHSIYAPVATPEQALEMFDSITYQKGCAVMRMLENFIGEDDFRTGLRAYMQEFQYGNAAGADLWQALQRASGQPVGPLMNSWVNQSGFPLVSLSVHQPTTGPAALVLSQKRFFSAPGVAPTEQVWSIPMVVRFQDDLGVHTHRFIFDGSAHTEPLPAHGPVRFCYGNAGDIGFYRLAPDPDALQALLQHGFSQLSAIEHVGLIEDQWALIRSGVGSVEPFVDVLCAAATIPEHSVLRTVVDRFGVLDRLIKATEDRPARLKLRATLSALLKPQLAALGFTPQPGEPQNDLQRRAVLLGALGSLAHDDEVIASAAAAAETERLDPSAVDANLAGPILAVAAKYGDEARYDLWVQTFLDRKRSGRSPQEVARYLHTLSSFRLPIHTEKTLGLVERGDIPQEALSQILVQLLSVRHAQQAAWTFFRSRWDLLRSRVGDMGLSKVVESLGFLPAVHRPEICDFFSTRTPAGAERALTRALERLDQSEELRQRITPSLLARIHRLG